jgi:hypothetical protein
MYILCLYVKLGINYVVTQRLKIDFYVLIEMQVVERLINFLLFNILENVWLLSLDRLLCKNWNNY